MTNFLKLDLSHARNVYVVGDIHGCFDKLIQKMDQIGFDYDHDFMLSVGDLVDRGPLSHFAVEFAEKPWFKYVLGNHEQIMAKAGGTSWHIQNGGSWFLNLDEGERQQHIDALWNAPLIMEVTTPSGARIGLVHAAFPFDEWTDETVNRAVTQSSEFCMWDRDDVRNPRPQGIKGIDHVFHGHNILKQPKTIGNITWLDTGAFRGGPLTIVRAP